MQMPQVLALMPDSEVSYWQPRVDSWVHQRQAPPQPLYDSSDDEWSW